MATIQTTEEILQAHKDWLYDRTDRNGTRYFVNYTCPRCGGRGVIPCYGHIDGGICFECGGAGKTHKPEVIKIYTPEHEAKLKADREKRATAKKEAKIADYRTHMTEHLADMGFGLCNDIAVIYRVLGNTFSIKDELKAEGCKYHSIIGWYSNRPLATHETELLRAHQVCFFNPETCRIEWLSDEELKLVCAPQQEPSKSIHQGQIGSSLGRNMKVINAIESTFTYGYRNITSHFYILQDRDENVYTWSTQKYLEVGKQYYVSGTVKEHSEYKNVPQTVLTRCKVVAL